MRSSSAWRSGERSQWSRCSRLSNAIITIVSSCTPDTGAYSSLRRNPGIVRIPASASSWSHAYVLPTPGRTRTEITAVTRSLAGARAMTCSRARVLDEVVAARQQRLARR